MTAGVNTALRRGVDVVGAALGLLLTSPLFAAIAVLVILDSPGGVFYRGERAGRWGRPFRILKFRTMVAGADTLGGPSTPADDPRITRVGRWLRRSKLDELPQLFNVLRGEMSIVGPRPEVPEYAALLAEEERAILSVRPGMTDWASIWDMDEGQALAGSADAERKYLEEIRPQKVRLQLKYVREQSLATDLQIIAQTAARLFRLRVAGERPTSGGPTR
jgi:lipopolysaccharide/colanic/teichoic acid biosynthesis glycosyltransferase